MYDIICVNKNDSIEFFGMNYITTLEILEDFYHSYILDVVNLENNNKYKIINKQSIKDFIKKEGK